MQICEGRNGQTLFADFANWPDIARRNGEGDPYYTDEKYDVANLSLMASSERSPKYCPRRSDCPKGSNLARSQQCGDLINSYAARRPALDRADVSFGFKSAV